MSLGDLIGIWLIGLDPGGGRCRGGRRGKGPGLGPVVLVTIGDVFLGSLARFFFILSRFAGGHLCLLLLLACGRLVLFPLVASCRLGFFSLLASSGLFLLALLASSRLGFFSFLASLGLRLFLLLARGRLGFLLLAAIGRLGLLALAPCCRLGFLALAAGRGLGLPALLPVRLGRLLVRNLDVSRSGGLDDGSDGALRYRGVVERRPVRLGSCLYGRLRLGDDVAGRRDVTCDERRVFW